MKLNTPFPFLLFFLLVFLGIYTCMSVKETKLEPNNDFRKADEYHEKIQQFNVVLLPGNLNFVYMYVSLKKCATQWFQIIKYASKSRR